MEEQAHTDEVLERLTLQQRLAGPDDPDTRITLQRSAATTLSGVLSPFHDFTASSHPPPSGPGAQQGIAMTAQQSRVLNTQESKSNAIQHQQVCTFGRAVHRAG
jgi:hypothetical protein